MSLECTTSTQKIESILMCYAFVVPLATNMDTISILFYVAIVMLSIYFPLFFPPFTLFLPPSIKQLHRHLNGESHVLFLGLIHSCSLYSWWFTLLFTIIYINYYIVLNIFFSISLHFIIHWLMSHPTSTWDLLKDLCMFIKQKNIDKWVPNKKPLILLHKNSGFHSILCFAHVPSLVCVCVCGCAHAVTSAV